MQACIVILESSSSSSS